jgi:hypothetical protein
MSAWWGYVRIMLWRMVYRSMLSLIGLCAFIGLCWLVGNVVSEKLGKIIILAALLCLFPAIFISIGWIGQAGKPTDPPPRRSRRLREVERGDTVRTQPEQAPTGATSVRRAA